MYVRIIVLLTVILTQSLFSQPELDIKPNRVEFRDIFNRVDHAFLINKGDQVLTIDSLGLKEFFYIIDFENNLELPFTINPDDSVRMNVTLSGYYYVTIADTVDTIFVYNGGINSPEPLRVKIDFFEDEFGEINGLVSDSLDPLENARIYFFYSGIYLLDTALTDASGNYQAMLPEGEYTIAAEKDGYYVIFHDSTYDPFFAEFVDIDTGSVKTINFNMHKITDSTMSVSGEIIDSANGINFDKGLVIIRRGTHVPGNDAPKINMTDTINTLAGFIREDGTYTIYLQQENYYFIQAYSNYFLPGYYNDEGIASVFWQNSDSILVDTTVINKNISLIRDSSYGGGSISGLINFQSTSLQAGFDGITLLVKSMENSYLYSYNFGKVSGEYKISNIPYGTYEVVAQKIGLENAVSQVVTIDPFNNQLDGILITFNITDIKTEFLNIPDKIELLPNYPNPFNPETKITFRLSEPLYISIKVYNILGKEIATLLNEFITAGTYSVNFYGTDLSSGVYFYSLSAGNFNQTRKMIFLK
jgi:hypothetical protein